MKVNWYNVGLAAAIVAQAGAYGYMLTLLVHQVRQS